MENKEKLYEKSLKLRPADRLKLMEMIAESLDQPDAKIEKIWVEEAEKRYKALKQNKVKTFSLDEIIKKYK